MNRSNFIELDSVGLCFSEFEYQGKKRAVPSSKLMDVTARTDGPFLGKIYDANADTFSDPPEPE